MKFVSICLGDLYQYYLCYIWVGKPVSLPNTKISLPYNVHEYRHSAHVPLKNCMKCWCEKPPLDGSAGPSTWAWRGWSASSCGGWWRGRPTVPPPLLHISRLLLRWSYQEVQHVVFTKQQESTMIALLNGTSFSKLCLLVRLSSEPSFLESCYADDL
jgi:hypothetical protein